MGNLVLLDVMKKHFANTEFDKTFMNEVTSFLREFIAKDNNHVEFFGSGLLGVYPVKWYYSDTDRWWDEIWQVDDRALRTDIWNCKGIDKKRIISSDSFNHAMIYSLYGIHHSPKLNEKEKESTKTMVMMCLNIKFISSILAHFFKFPANKEVAEKAFNSLSMRYDIKVEGSWGKMIQKRSEDLVSPKGRYYRAYTTYYSNDEIVKCINDIQCRCKDTIKYMTEVYYETLNKGLKIATTQSTIEIDGVGLVKDIVRNKNVFVRYIKDVINTGDGYYKEMLTDIVFQAVPSLNADLFTEIQDGVIKLYKTNAGQKLIDKQIDDLIVYTLDFLTANNIKENDIPGITYRMKHVFMSGRVTDQMLEDARKDFGKIAEKINPKFKRTPLIPERCAFFLYLVLRTITMKHFG